MNRGLIILISVALAACGRSGQQAQAEDRNGSASNVVAQAEDECALPTLSLADDAPLSSDLLGETKANFATAYRSACAKGVLEGRQLADPKASDQGKLFLINAPEANVASIYRSEIDGNRMVLEYPFLTVDGKSQVPSAGELEEAVYCAVIGATPEEQGKTGRCLVD